MASDASTAAALAACSDAQKGMDSMTRYAVRTLNSLTIDLYTFSVINRREFGIVSAQSLQIQEGP